jgi:hypothetical protein
MTSTDTGRSTTARLVDDAVAAQVTAFGGDTEIFTYRYRPALDAFECPAPYFHPLRTLSGGVVTVHRPYDHRWHKGLAMTASHLSGQNFWGGVSYVHGAPNGGYVVLPNIGALEHRGFTAFAPDGAAHLIERVDWISAEGEQWIEEAREISVLDVDAADGRWTLEFASALTNVREQALEFGSPTVFGRVSAGYSGFFWRGPRSFTGGRVLAGNGLEGPETMGERAPWLAYGGEFDEIDGQATLLFRAAPDTPGGEPFWFVRNDPFAAVNPSLAFFEGLRLPPRHTLARRYRVTIADGAWNRERIEAHLAGRDW